jgi:glycosyltransferase involved in cell wall biosynthesis
MKIALVSKVRPVMGSGAGIVEYAYRLYEHIRRGNDVDIVYAIDSPRRNNTLGLVYANTLFKSKVRDLASKEYDIIHITDHEIGFMAEMLNGNSGARIVTTVHDLERFDERLHRGLFQRSYNKIVRRNVECALKFSDAILCNSSQTLEDVKRRFRTPRICEAIPLGVKESILGRVHPKKESDEIFRVGYIGSLAYHKNLMLLLKAAKLMKDEQECRFIIYGTGEDRGALLRYKRENALDNVEFRGFADERGIAHTYDSFDAFVFPSMYEGFGFPILEAQARGLPVILYEQGRIPAEVGRYCIKARDENHIARIIRDLRDNGYSRRSRNRAMAYARRFTWERCARETLKVYRRAISQHKT